MVERVLEGAAANSNRNAEAKLTVLAKAITASVPKFRICSLRGLTCKAGAEFALFI